MNESYLNANPSAVNYVVFEAFRGGKEKFLSQMQNTCSGQSQHGCSIKQRCDIAKKTITVLGHHKVTSGNRKSIGNIV